MRKGQNYNHASPMVPIKVYPIKSLYDIESIKNLLADNPRNYLLFILGINTNLNTKEFLKIKVNQVRKLNPGESILIENPRTNRTRQVPLNYTCVKAVEGYLFQSRHLRDSDSLFAGYQGPLSIPYVGRLVKSWCSKIKLEGNYASQSSRKTWGYHQYAKYHENIYKIMKYLHLKNLRQTLSYLCIEMKIDFNGKQINYINEEKFSYNKNLANSNLNLKFYKSIFENEL
jgi:hypothetical protein